jgi:NADPH-dependent 2,4-dienoyl-CoA reductase/sulfur reductase-like enzyme
MSQIVDLLIVGAGPAGMQAAVTARRHGLDVLVVDEQPSPGGQIWRNVEAVSGTPRAAILGSSYAGGGAAIARFRGSGAAYEPRTQVWQIEPGGTAGPASAYMTRDGAAARAEARCLLLATGAQERPVPFPGWTLPGVMTVGAAQILLKSSGQIPDGPAWIAGNGPLPLLYATQLLKAGGRLAGFLDTTPSARRAAASRGFLGAVFAAPGDIAKGISWIATLRRAGVTIVRGATGVEALGGEVLEKLCYRDAAGTETIVPASVLLVHEGIVPTIHPTLAVGCAHRWNAPQACFAPELDEWGETSQPGIFVAGDGAGIGGGAAAGPRGAIAALAIAARLGRLSAAEAEVAARSERVALRRALASRPFLDALYSPRPEILVPEDRTLVCRCEEITAAEVRAQVAYGRPGPNQVKAFTRAGMGPCQGRQCAYTVAHILADAERRAVPDLGLYRARPPLKPITIGELAALDETSLLHGATT